MRFLVHTTVITPAVSAAARDAGRAWGKVILCCSSPSSLAYECENHTGRLALSSAGLDILKSRIVRGVDKAFGMQQAVRLGMRTGWQQACTATRSTDPCSSNPPTSSPGRAGATQQPLKSSSPNQKAAHLHAVLGSFPLPLMPRSQRMNVKSQKPVPLNTDCRRWDHPVGKGGPGVRSQRAGVRKAQRERHSRAGGWSGWLIWGRAHS